MLPCSQCPELEAACELALEHFLCKLRATRLRATLEYPRSPLDVAGIEYPWTTPPRWFKGVTGNVDDGARKHHIFDVRLAYTNAPRTHGFPPAIAVIALIERVPAKS